MEREIRRVTTLIPEPLPERSGSFVNSLVISSVKSLAASVPSECIILDDSEGDDDVNLSFNRQSSSDSVQVKSEPCENILGSIKVVGNEGGDIAMHSKVTVSSRKRVNLPEPVLCADLMDKFVLKCKEIDKTSDMQTILDKRIIQLYNDCDQSYKTSSPFYTQVKDLYSKIEKHPEDVYVFIKYLHEELKKASKAALHVKRQKADDSDQFDGKTVKFENKQTRRNAARLSKALTKLHKRIKELESQEVCWDSEDEGDSSYIQLQRYKERAVKVHEKLCSITKESKLAGRIKNIHFSGTPFPEVNRCIERYVNSTGLFPDYKDILDVVQRTNSENELNLLDEQLQEIAKKAFQEVGKELQLLRQRADAESILLLVDEYAGDPAENDDQLQHKLESNKTHWKKINEIIDEFASKQENGTEESGEQDEEEDDDEEDEEESEEKDENMSELLSSESDDDQGSGPDLKSLMSNEVKPNQSAVKESSPTNNKLETSSPPESPAHHEKHSPDEDGSKNQKTVLCDDSVSPGHEEPKAVISSNESSDIVILDDSGDESSVKEKCNEIPKIKPEVADEDIPCQGKIKVKSISSLGGHTFS